jgi:anaerobic selenocysteine-containing dehydrogenase
VASVPSVPPAAEPAPAAPGRFTLIAPRPHFSGVAVERTPALVHQRAPWVMLNHEDAARLGVSEHDAVTVRHAGGDHTGPLRTSRRLRAGAVRINWTGPPVAGEAEVITG